MPSVNHSGRDPPGDWLVGDLGQIFFSAYARTSKRKEEKLTPLNLKGEKKAQKWSHSYCNQLDFLRLSFSPSQLTHTQRLSKKGTRISYPFRQISLNDRCIGFFFRGSRLMLIWKVKEREGEKTSSWKREMVLSRSPLPIDGPLKKQRGKISEIFVRFSKYTHNQAGKKEISFHQCWNLLLWVRAHLQKGFRRKSRVGLGGSIAFGRFGKILACDRSAEGHRPPDGMDRTSGDRG